MAGPTGGTKRSHVGRVFPGLAAGRKIWVKKLDLKGTRREIKERATENALKFFYKIVFKEAGVKL